MKYWYREITLVARNLLLECSQCQFIRRPDAVLPDLNPILPLSPLNRWTIDFKFFNGISLLVAIEYSKGWIEAE